MTDTVDHVHRHWKYDSRARRVIVCAIASAALLPAVAWAWTPTTPQISVSVYGGTGNDSGTSVAVDGSGNIYTTGYFSGTADFDPGPGTTNLTSAGSNDVFVSKLDASGNLVWAKTFGSTSNDVGNSVAVDGSGNVYTTGHFGGTVDFDPGPGTTNLTSVGSTDVFVSKLDTSGNLVWAKTFGGTTVDVGNSVAVDGSGNVYTTGNFEGTVDFDPGPGTTTLSSAGSIDVFVSKLNASGNLVWAKTFGGTANDRAVSVAVDGSGNVYTTGHFGGTVDFDPGPGTTNLASAGGEDVFVSKLDASGNLAWAKTFGGTSDDRAVSVAVDSFGNIHTAGYFAGTADFDPGPGTTNLTSAGSNDVFVSKLDTSGNLVWAKTFGGTSNDRAVSAAVDSSGNIYTTGHFTGTADFDPGPGTTNLTSAGNTDVFVSKLDTSGNFMWAQSFGGATGDYPAWAAVDSSGNIYTTGYFAGTVDFDPGPGTTNLTAAAGSDAFVLKLDASGSAAATPPPGAAPTVVLARSSATSSSTSLTFTLTATSGQIDCGTVSTTDGTDFDFTNISSISVTQTSSTLCTISATSTIAAGSSGTSTLAEATSFAVSYTGSLTQTNISSGAPSSITVTIPAATSSTTSTSTSTSTTAPTSSQPAMTTTTTATSAQSSTPTGVTTTTTLGQSAFTTVAPRTNPTSTTVVRDANDEDTSSTTTSTLPPVPAATTPPDPAVQQLAPIDVPDIDRGGAAVVIGGEEVPIEITRENDQVLIRAGVFNARFAGLRRDGSIIPLDSDGFIRVESGDAIRVEVTGFASGSEVEVRLYSEPMLLGKATVDADGTMLSAYEIPDGVERGPHRVVLVGMNQRNDDVTFTAGIIIGAEATTSWAIRLVIAVPIGLAMLAGTLLPAILRRRREPLR